MLVHDLELERQVGERLGWLHLGAFQRIVQLYLRSKGYREVRIVGSPHPRGRRETGGFDLVARTPRGLLESRVLIQVKQGRTVQRRYVDELRGAMQRQGASQGMIFTTAQFSRKAQLTAEIYPVRPVLLVDGPILARLMVEECLGVRIPPVALQGFPNLVLDELFFDSLEQAGR